MNSYVFYRNMSVYNSTEIKSEWEKHIYNKFDCTMSKNIL